MVVKIHTEVFWFMTPGRLASTFLQKQTASKFRVENGDSMFL